MSSRTPSRGLPTNPRPRSKSAAAPGSASARQTSSTGQLRPALPNNPRARPPLPTAHSRDNGGDSGVKGSSSRWLRKDSAPNVEARPRASDDSSANSTTSSGSSFWSRGNPVSSAASSRTDLQRDNGHPSLDDENGKPRNMTNGGTPDGESHLDAKELAGLAWGRVAGVANVLTQEVSKVWANGLTPLNKHSEETDRPAEEESHLLRVMRNYHLSKARSPADLPDWLFSERERGQAGGILRSEGPNDAGSRSAQRRDDTDSNVGPNSKSSGLRMRSIENLPRAAPGRNVPSGKSTGADRLKMIRDRRAMPSGNRV